MSKLADERTRKQLLEIAAMPGNDTCADCKSRAPRWASHNLGIFICVHCATVHRKIGTHVTKVKSLTLDSWTKDQVEVMRQNGNLKSNAFFNPNESRNPPPTNLEESERDGELEKYIRSKYEYRRFVDRTPRQPQQPQNQPQLPPRAQSTPLTNQQPPPAASVQRPPSAMPAPAQPVFGNNSTLQYRPSTTSVPQAQAQSAVTPAPAPAPAAPPKPSGGVWDDILAIQSGPAPPTVNSLGGNPYANSTQANSTFAQLSQPGAPAFNSQQGAFSPSPAQFGQSQPTGAFPGMASMPQPLSGANPPTRSFTMPSAMPSTSMPAMSPQFQAMAAQATSSPGNPFFNNMQQPQQFTPSPLTSPPLNTYAQQPQSFAQQAFQQQQQQQQPQSFSQPFQQSQQPSAFQASPSFFQQAQQVQQQPAFGQQQAAFGQQPQTAFTPQQQQPAFNLQNFMPQPQQQQMQPTQTNPFSPGWPGQQQQQQPQQQFPGAFGQQQMYSQPGWPSS